MTKTKRYAGLGMVAALVLGLCLLAAAKPAPAASTADQPAAIITWPYIKVDLSNSVDTRLHLVNHSGSPKLAHCFYIDATTPNKWRETDFFISLTPGQPISWPASEGLRGPIVGGGGLGVCVSPSGEPGVLGKLCRDTSECGGAGYCAKGLNNNGTAVPPVSNPFEGALKCVQLDPNADGGPAPDDENSLTGMATIVRATPDVEKYSAIGLKAIFEANNGDNELVIGGDDGAEYEAAPSSLIVNHLFDDSTNPLEVVPGGNPALNRTVHTYLTLIPVSDNFLTGTPGKVTAQFLVFNEFEQRFSTSISVPCATTSKLSAIDTTSYNRSIWSAHVAGTIAGQTRIRGVGTTDRSLLALARLTNGWETWADYAVHQQGDHTSADHLITP